jgi:hypothetical protein
MSETIGIKPDPAMEVIRVDGVDYEVTTNGNFIVPRQPGEYLLGRFPHSFEQVFLELSSTDPADKATDVGIDTDIDFIFAEEIEEGTDMENKITVACSTGSVEFTAAIDPIGEKTLTITPDDDLAYSTLYTVTVREGAVVSQAEGLTTDGDLVISFTTAAEE